MGFFDAVKPPTDKAPQIRDYKIQGSGVIEITGARLKQGEQPKTANKKFLIVDGVNVDHPACPAGTKITVLIVDMADEYAGKDIGRLLVGMGQDPTPEAGDRMFAEDKQGCAGVRVGVTVRDQPYGKRSEKFGQTFLGVDFYAADQVSGVRPALVAPSAPAAPAAPPPAPAAKPFPPAGWEEYSPGWFCDAARNVKSEAELRAM